MAVKLAFVIENWFCRSGAVSNLALNLLRGGRNREVTESPHLLHSYSASQKYMDKWFFEITARTMKQKSHTHTNNNQDMES